MLSKAGSFTLNKAAGAQAIIGVGFTPKALIVWTEDAHQMAAANNELHRSFGVATGPTAQWCQGNSYWGSPGYTYDRFRTDAILTCGDSSNAVQQYFNVALTSFDADGFTLNVIDYAILTGASQNVVVHYLALGGADLSAKAGNFNWATGLAAQSVIGMGFAPKALIQGWTRSSTFTGANGNTGSEMGMSLAVSGAKQLVQFTRIDEATTSGAGNSRIASRQLTDSCLLRTDGAGIVIEKAALNSLDADGFTCQFSTRSAIAFMTGYLALGGAQINADLITFNQPTAIGSQNLTTVPMDMKAMLLSGNGFAAAITNQTSQRHSLGAIASPTSREASSFYAAGTTLTTLPSSADSSIRGLIVTDNTIGTTLAEADVTAFSGSTATLNWTKADAVARQFGALAIGTSAASGTIAWTEDNDTYAANAVLTDRAAVAWTEDNDSGAIAASVTDRAAVAWTEADDTSAIAAIVTDRAAVAWTEADDTFAIVAKLFDPAAIVWTEANDTFAMAGLARPQPRGAGMSLVPVDEFASLVPVTEFTTFIDPQFP